MASAVLIAVLIRSDNRFLVGIGATELGSSAQLPGRAFDMLQTAYARRPKPLTVKA